MHAADGGGRRRDGPGSRSAREAHSADSASESAAERRWQTAGVDSSRLTGPPMPLHLAGCRAADGGAGADVRLRDHPLRRHPSRPRRHLRLGRHARPGAALARPHRDDGPQRHRRRRRAVRRGTPARRVLLDARHPAAGLLRIDDGDAAGLATVRPQRPQRRRSAWSSSSGAPLDRDAGVQSRRHWLFRTATSSSAAGLDPAHGSRFVATSTETTPTTRPRITHSMSPSGRRPPTTRSAGRARGATAGPAGTPSARPWCCRCSGRASTCTAAAPTSPTRTTPARPRWPRPPPG